LCIQTPTKLAEHPNKKKTAIDIMDDKMDRIYNEDRENEMKMKQIFEKLKMMMIKQSTRKTTRK